MPGGISTHVLDTAQGKPAAGIPVRLYRESTPLAFAFTDDDGRCRLFDTVGEVRPGTYRLHFDTGAYFAATATPALYPEIVIAFQVADTDERGSYHLPLLLTPFGYTTYRGS